MVIIIVVNGFMIAGFLFFYLRYLEKKSFCLSVFYMVTNGNCRAVKFYELYSVAAIVEGTFKERNVNLALNAYGQIFIRCYMNRSGWRNFFFGHWKSIGVELNFKDKSMSVKMMSNAYERLIEKVDQELEH